MLGLTALIASSTALFATTTGFSFADLVTWAGSILLLMLGAGLGLVNAMLPWVIALIVFGVIIGLIYKGMRFLHILR
jgi:Na+/phosphate symporter